MLSLGRLVRRWEQNTVSGHPRLEIFSAFVAAPLLEEAVFRIAPARVARGRRWFALASAALFGLMHQRYGAWFVGYAFAGGLLLWATNARWGASAAVLVHSGANVVDLSVGWRRRLLTHSASRRAPSPQSVD